MILNESKTKAIQFGKKNNMELFFNKKKIIEIHEYKYLGNVIKSTQFTNEDVFQNNYQNLCDKARKAIFSFQRKTQIVKSTVTEAEILHIRYFNKTSFNIRQ